MKKMKYAQCLTVLAAAFLIMGTVPAAASVREVNVAVLMDSIGDLSYNDGIVAEVFRAAEEYRDSGEVNLNVKLFEINENAGDMKTALEAACQEGDLILIATYLAPPILEPAAAYFSDKRFILIDAEATGGNIYSAMFKPSEAAFLCGALAAQMSQTGIVGIVIGMDLPALHDFTVGYILGARAVNPDCIIIVSTVGNFYDEERGYELAARQFERGADVCFSVAGGAGLGSIRAAFDYGHYAIGVDVDQTEFVVPELRDTIITSCLKNFEALITVTLENYLAGALNFGESGRLGLKDGAVGIARNQNYFNMTPQNVRDVIDDLEEKIRSGSIQVQSAFEMTQAEIEELIRSARRGTVN